MIFGFSGGADWNIDSYYVEIVDRIHNVSCVYRYLGLGLPPDIATMPNPLRIETGITVGAGLSSTVGKLTVRATDPLTLTGAPVASTR
jgi:hypothetical protein